MWYWSLYTHPPGLPPPPHYPDWVKAAVWVP